MNGQPHCKPWLAIACGGTGGHLFPGLAVADPLTARGCGVGLLISPKAVDQQAVKSALAGRAPTPGALEAFTLPAIGLQDRNYFSFAAGFVKSLGVARRLFRQRQPLAVLAMGGFTSAPPILAAKSLGIRTYLHESNAIPGRANRLLARWVDEVFVGFAGAAERLRARQITVTGTPVRPQFQRRDAAESRAALGLDRQRPVVLVVGGSQGASGLNALVLAALPLLAQKNWQWLHLTGNQDLEKVRAAYAAVGLHATVRPFLTEMELALAAATATVSRAGASSLAELAALQLPSLLVPFPAAADNHQFFNAQNYVQQGAARLLEQARATPRDVAAALVELVEDSTVRAQMATALARWQAPHCAQQIADRLCREALPRTADAPPPPRPPAANPNPLTAA